MLEGMDLINANGFRYSIGITDVLIQNGVSGRRWWIDFNKPFKA
jgi:hypothetical protein